MILSPPNVSQEATPAKNVWDYAGMGRDLQSMEQICYLGEQELERYQAPQLEAVTQSYFPLSREQARGDHMTNPNPFEEKKATLINKLNDTRSFILEAAASIPDNRVDEVFVGSWGILELLAHLRGWDLTNIEAARDILSGKVPNFYAEYDKDWASYNRKLVARYRQADLQSMISLVDASRSDLVALLNQLDADDIFGDHGVRRGNYKVTIARLIEADIKDGIEHLDQIRRFLD